MKQKNRYPNGYLLFWYSEANQIRTILCLSKSGFYVVKCDGFCTIFVVERDDQLVIVEINPVDKGINEPLPVRLLAHIQNPELVQEMQQMFFCQFRFCNPLVGNPDFQIFFGCFRSEERRCRERV